MADDVTGAVRRTPRPACDCEMFDFCDKCWGPEQQREAQIRQLAYCEEVIPSGPEDAEQCPNPREPGSIHCATHQRAPVHEVMHDAGETAEEAVRRLAAEVVGLRQNQRPVVLLRAEDCACRYGDDCPHGPEPVDALDLAVWLHAELKHKLDLPCGSCHPCAHWAEETWRREGRSVPHFHDWQALVAERDALQARLDTINETLSRAAGMMTIDARDWSLDRSDVWLYGLLVGWGCDELHQHDEACGGDAALREVCLQHAWSVEDVLRIRRFRAALQGDQPTEPWTPSVGERVTGVETQNVGRPVVTGYFHSCGADGLSWLKIHQDDPETAQRYLVGTATLRPAPAEPDPDGGCKASIAIPCPLGNWQEPEPYHVTAGICQGCGSDDGACYCGEE